MHVSNQTLSVLFVCDVDLTPCCELKLSSWCRADSVEIDSSFACSVKKKGAFVITAAYSYMFQSWQLPVFGGRSLRLLTASLITSLQSREVRSEKWAPALCCFTPLRLSRCPESLGLAGPSLYNDGNSFLLNRSVIIVKPLEWRRGD